MYHSSKNPAENLISYKRRKKCSTTMHSKVKSILSCCLMIVASLNSIQCLEDKTQQQQNKQQDATTATATAAATATTTASKMHKLMSQMDLRRTFQVDSHDQVPEYEILKLTVHQDGSHLISPISDLGELITTTTVSRHKRSLRNDNDQDDEKSKISDIPETPNQNDQLILMNLQTFGQNFKLRLKRNTDFQQRIKHMRMFMAESTQDGLLRYTEVNNQQRPDGNSQHKQKQQRDDGIGSTYHDKENLAAFLIDQDTKTGQLQLDGTIGNDFVIKPMPRATIEALRERQLAKQSEQQQPTQADSLTPLASNNSAEVESLANVDLERSSGRQQQPVATTNNSSGANQESPVSSAAGPPAAAVNLEQLATHMHDDDPHDDDEMFLDEDEALELAHLQASVSIESNHTAHQDNDLSGTNEKIPQLQSNQLPQPRQLSKAASERKWKKYRKLMAQTQVPKPNAVEQHQPDQQPQQPDSARTRRHTTQQQQQQTDHNNSHQPKPIQISHHIIYRQKPSSEESSGEHKHSFMLAPGQQSMERMARRFAKRSANDDQASAGNTLDGGGGPGRLSAASASFDATADEADFASDPLGGQFYLEPGLLSLDPNSAADWSLIGSGRRTLGSPPPYAMNGTNDDWSLDYHSNSTGRTATGDSGNSTTTTTRRTAHGARFKRNARGGGGMRAGGSQVRRKRQAPDTVWPEVLLVVDYDSFLLHGGDSRDVKRYFVSFWNGVDLRYKLLVHPHIRISLAGMIVAKDRDATPYLERNRLRAPNADAVDAAGALTDMGKYLYREDRLPTYDLAVVITKLDMCRRRYEGGRCNRGTAGFAYVGGACVVNKRLEKVNSVAIIEDSGGFSGIIVAAHEVGHLLGCVHDGSPPPSYLGGPGATHCPWEDGFIMSDLRHTERGFRWSQCSVEQFKHFLNGETATCLYNYPHESQMLHRLLPGTMLSLDDQCKRDRGTNACFKDARVCAQLFCFDSASGYCVSYRPAAEGSPCGEGQVCRNGKCVGEIENIIPDYTHQSQTVVARRPSLVAPVVGPPVPIGRLADNGLSASSTSTATSSPDNSNGKLPVSPAAGSPSSSSGASSSTSSSPAVSSRRMDSFPIETPALVNNNDAYSASTFGGRTFDPLASSVTVGANYNYNRNVGQQQHSLQKSAKLLNDGYPATRNHHHHQTGNSAYQQRTGHQNVNSRVANQQGQANQQQNHNRRNQHRTNGNSNPNSRSSPLPPTASGMHTSASSLAQYQYSAGDDRSINNKQNSNNNNLLTTSATNVAFSNNLKSTIEPHHHHHQQHPAPVQPINENGAKLQNLSYQSSSSNSNNRQQHQRQPHPAALNNNQHSSIYQSNHPLQEQLDTYNTARTYLNPYTSSGLEPTTVRLNRQHEYYNPLVVRS